MLEKNDISHAVACLKYIEELALRFVKLDSKYGDDIDVRNNASDIRKALIGALLSLRTNTATKPNDV